MKPAIEAKRTALLQYKKSPSGKTLQTLRLARSNCQRIARKCANNYWLNLCEDIEDMAHDLILGHNRCFFAYSGRVHPTHEKSA